MRVCVLGCCFWGFVGVIGGCWVGWGLTFFVYFSGVFQVSMPCPDLRGAVKPLSFVESTICFVW